MTAISAFAREILLRFGREVDLVPIDPDKAKQYRALAFDLFHMRTLGRITLEEYIKALRTLKYKLRKGKGINREEHIALTVNTITRSTIYNFTP